MLVIPRTVLVMLCLSPLILFAQDLTLKIGDVPPKLEFDRFSPEEVNEKPDSWEKFKDQVVVIDFWATWCVPCRQAFPKLNNLVKEFEKKPVTFLSITYEPASMLKPFFEQHKLETVIGIDRDFAMFKSFKAWGIPMVVIVNKKGKIAGVIHPNYLTGEVIEEVLAGKIPEVKQAAGWPDPAGAEEHFRSLIK